MSVEIPNFELKQLPVSGKIRYAPAEEWIFPEVEWAKTLIDIRDAGTVEQQKMAISYATLAIAGLNRGFFPLARNRGRYVSDNNCVTVHMNFSNKKPALAYVAANNPVRPMKRFLASYQTPDSATPFPAFLVLDDERDERIVMHDVISSGTHEQTAETTLYGEYVLSAPASSLNNHNPGLELHKTLHDLGFDDPANDASWL